MEKWKKKIMERNQIWTKYKPEIMGIVLVIMVISGLLIYDDYQNAPATLNEDYYLHWEEGTLINTEINDEFTIAIYEYNDGTQNWTGTLTFRTPPNMKNYAHERVYVHQSAYEILLNYVGEDVRIHYVNSFEGNFLQSVEVMSES